MATEVIVPTADIRRIEAPVTVKAYFMCAFAAFGGFFFGFDSGYISGAVNISQYRLKYGLKHEQVYST